MLLLAIPVFPLAPHALAIDVCGEVGGSAWTIVDSPSATRSSRRGDLLTSLELAEYREYEGGYWRPHRMSMQNHQTGKSTDLIYSDYRFGTNLDENDFVKGVLQRIR